jgi:hypothetical protein
VRRIMAFRPCFSRLCFSRQKKFFLGFRFFIYLLLGREYEKVPSALSL